MPKIRAVLFDVYSTLIDLRIDEENPQVYHFLSNWLTYQGIQIGPGQLQQLYFRLAAEEFASSPHDFPDIEIGNVFRGILREATGGLSQADEGSLVRDLAILFRILTTVEIALIPETSDALRALGDYVHIGIVSNTQRLFTLSELKKFQIADHVDVIVFSSDVLASKPNPRIFQRSLQELGVQPEETVFVGDNLFDDVWGAQQMGMRTLWFDRGNPVKLPDDIEQPRPDAQFRRGSSRSLYDLLRTML